MHSGYVQPLWPCWGLGSKCQTWQILLVVNSEAGLTRADEGGMVKVYAANFEKWIGFGSRDLESMKQAERSHKERKCLGIHSDPLFLALKNGSHLSFGNRLFPPNIRSSKICLAWITIFFKQLFSTLKAAPHLIPSTQPLYKWFWEQGWWSANWAFDQLAQYLSNTQCPRTDHISSVSTKNTGNGHKTAQPIVLSKCESAEILPASFAVPVFLLLSFFTFYYEVFLWYLMGRIRFRHWNQFGSQLPLSSFSLQLQVCSGQAGLSRETYSPISASAFKASSWIQIEFDWVYEECIWIQIPANVNGTSELWDSDGFLGRSTSFRKIWQ